jgi:pectinesterase
MELPFMNFDKGMGMGAKSGTQKNSRSSLLFPIIILLLAVSLIDTGSFAQGKRVMIKVTNPLNLNRPHEMIVLKWNTLQELISMIDPAVICVFDAKTNEQLTTQIIDEDQNGKPEEMIFLSDFRAKETKQFVIEFSCSKDSKSALPLTYVGYMIPREDIAWENDKNAFRIYGPALAKDVGNGIDVWTKRVRYPIVKKWYTGDEAPDSIRISYHEDHGEGADFFSVGRTLGAGSCALLQNDSLCQPGVFSTYKILATGPIRALFEITYKPVQVNGKIISEKKRITLDAGSNLNKVEVTYTCSSSVGKMPFAAGLVKRKGVTTYFDKENFWTSLWGLTNEKEENGSLGTAIVMTKKIFNGMKEDSIHVLISGTAELGIPLTYYTGAGWTRSGDFNNAEEWNEYLKEFSLQLKSPLEVTVEKIVK